MPRNAQPCWAPLRKALRARWVLAVGLLLLAGQAASCSFGVARVAGAAGRKGAASGAFELVMQETAGFERQGETVRAGLPFPPGALAGAANIRVVGSDGREMPSQRRPLAAWPDGSVRWMELFFEPSVAASATGRYRVEFGPRVRAGKVPSPLTAEVQKGAIRIDTGRLLLELPAAEGAFGKTGAQPGAAKPRPAGVWIDADGDGKYSADERVLAAPGLELFAELEALKPGAAAGRFTASTASADPEDVRFELEESGPLRACAVWRGWHRDAAGRRACPFVVRIYAYRGRAFLRVVHTLVLSENPAASRVAEAGLALVLRDRAATAGQALRQTVVAPRRYPDLSGFQTRDVLLDGDRTVAEGRGQRHLSTAAGRFEIAAAPARPVEDAPWELRVEPDGSRLAAVFWPRWDQESIDARGPEERSAPGFVEFARTESHERFWPREGPASSARGAARTHELWLDFGTTGANGDARGADFAARAGSPLVAWPGAACFIRSDVFGRFALPVSAEEEDSGATLGLGQERLGAWLALHQRERFGWLGLWDYGDYQTIYRRRGDLDVGERWWNWSGPWGWMQGREGLADALLMPWLRRGRPADFERFRAAVEHNIDVDTVHAFAAGPDADAGAGMAGATHGPGASHWSVPASLAATWPAAWLDHYYLTGERRGIEALAELMRSLEGKTVADFAAPGRPWSAEQAGFIRARLAAAEAFGAPQEAAAAAALEFLDGLTARDLGSERWARDLAPALIRHHRLTASDAAARLIERGARGYLATRGPLARSTEIERNCYDSCAYAWALTGDTYFLERGRALAGRSAAARAGRIELAPGAKPPVDLSNDAREALELGTLPYLVAAEREAGLIPPATPSDTPKVTRP